MNNPQGTEPDHVQEFRLDLGRVRDQVDDLQIKAAERKKPWYKQIPLVVSLSALLFSVGFNVVGVHDRSNADKKAKLEELRQTILQLADIRAEESQESVTPSNQAIFQARSSIRNAKRQVLIESADALIHELGDAVSANTFSMLAYEQIADGRFDDGKAYYERALKASKDTTLTTVTILQGIANLYITPGTSIVDQKKSREHWARAWTILDRRTDPYGLMLRVNHLLMHEYVERLSGEKTFADSLLGATKIAIEKIPAENPIRNQLRATVAQRETAMSDTVQTHVAAQPANVDEVIGEWRIRFPDAPAIFGKATFVRGQQPGFLLFAADVFENDVLVRRIGGSAIAVGVRDIRVDWNAYLLNGQQAIGVTTLRIAKDKVMRGTDAALGASPASIVLTRLSP